MPNKIKPAFIYGLRCPVAGQIRYIGKSTQPKTRAYLHLFAAARGYHKIHSSRWLRKLQALGLKPTLEILFEVPHGESWQRYERKFIADGRTNGWPLTNQTAGGEGVEFLSEKQFLSARAARKAGFTPEVRARISASLKLAWADPEKRKRISDSQKKSSQKPENKERIANLWRHRTAEGERRRMAAVNAYCSDPENKRKLAERMKLRTDPKTGRFTKAN